MASGDLLVQGCRVNQVLSRWHFRCLAGPGAITAVMISFQTAGLIVTALSILIVIGITYIELRYIDRIYRVIGRRGSIIVTRVFAVLIAAIAVQFIVDGARALFG